MKLRIMLFFIISLSVMVVPVEAKRMTPAQRYIQQLKQGELFIAQNEVDAEEQSSGKKVKRSRGQIRRDIRRVEDYLNDIDTLISSFTQVAPDGSMSTGMFYMARPGRLRWQYDPPVPITIVVNKGSVTYFDRELKQKTFGSLSDTPLEFLLQPHINLSSGVKVDKILRSKGFLHLTVVEDKRNKREAVILSFSENPLRLKKMTVIDGVGNRTNISFRGTVFGKPIDSTLFRIDSKMQFPRKKN